MTDPAADDPEERTVDPDGPTDTHNDPLTDGLDEPLYIPRCPRCEAPMVRVTSLGPDTHRAGACGCRVAGRR